MFKKTKTGQKIPDKMAFRVPLPLLDRSKKTDQKLLMGQVLAEWVEKYKLLRSKSIFCWQKLVKSVPIQTHLRQSFLSLRQIMQKQYGYFGNDPNIWGLFQRTDEDEIVSKYRK